MRTFFLGLALFLLPHFSTFAQLDSIAVTTISFTPGVIHVQDTTLEMPVMQIKLKLPDIQLLGKITFDVMDAEGVNLFFKRELLQEDFAALWSEGFLTVPIDFILHEEIGYQVKTTLQTPELSYLPQLIYTYPQ